MSKIQILDKQVADQVAAGEVIEGPWCIVKELIENALDAGSTQVDINTQDAGIKSLVVIDNGIGMSVPDAKLCVMRHATSKLTALKDLDALNSFGFRGEALAAIASVCHMSITTRQAEQNVAFQLNFDGGVCISTQEVGAPVGTRLSIRDVFYNTPARLKFLKSTRWENARIQQIVRDMIFPVSHIGVTLRMNDKVLLDTPAYIEEKENSKIHQNDQSLLERAYVCLGEDTRGQLYSFNYQTPNLKVKGYLGAPLVTRRDRRGIKIFVNNRYVEDNCLTQAIRAAYRTLLEVGRFPICALNVHIDPTCIDVNVHPQKRQVRFKQAERINGCLISAIREFLSQTPWLNRKTSHRTKAFEPLQKVYLTPSFTSVPVLSKLPSAIRDPQPVRVARNSVSRSINATLPVCDSLTKDSQRQSTIDPTTVQQQLAKKQLDLTLGSTQHTLKRDNDKTASTEESNKLNSRSLAGAQCFSQLAILGQVCATYLVLRGPEGLIVLDQHTAHECVVFENLCQDVKHRRVQCQELLLPLEVPLRPARMQALQEHSQQLLDYGLYAEPFGPTQGILRALPTGMHTQEAKQMLYDTLDELDDVKEADSLQERREKLCASIACHGCIRAGQTLSHEEIRTLLKQLDSLSFTLHCPHSRPILRFFSSKHMARWFDRT